MSGRFPKSFYRDWRFWGVALWFGFTLSLAIWQAIFSQKTLLQLSSLSLDQAQPLERHIRMVQMESLTMIALLLIGGATLGMLIRRERQSSNRLREFFATFTHEIKTSLTSLRLQVEILEDSLSKSGAGKRADRILSDLTRIDLQLENSLQLAREAQEQLFTEELSLREMVSSLQHSFSIPIHLNRDCRLRADRRLFESILRNLAQNAMVHGNAQNLYFECQGETPNGLIRLLIEDDGKGAAVDADKIGTLFYRPTPTSKNGIGLYLVRSLSKKLGGDVRFIPKGTRGFGVELTIPGARP